MVPRGVSPIVPQSRRKWLNVVFDLNKVLCQTALKLYVDNMRTHRLEDRILCHRVPTIVGPKAVFARQDVGEFLRQVFDIADRVLVWTTMLKHNAEPVAKHLFCRYDLPFRIMGQEFCKKIELKDGYFLKYGLKMHCLKVLSEALFNDPTLGTSFTADNMLLIDESPEKSVCNENGNAIFLDTWNHRIRRDNVLLGVLLPWLRRVHSKCPPGQLCSFVDANHIGQKPLSASDSTLKDMMPGMQMSVDEVGFRYELPGIGLVIEPRQRRT